MRSNAGVARLEARRPTLRPIRIAAQLHPQHGAWHDLRAAAVRAEEMGFDIVYTWDHFFPLYGDPDGEHFECWSLLAGLAEATSRIELGPLVTCNSYRNPQLLADIVRTVDHISGGRVINGIGAGWFSKDYREYGYEFGSIGDRLGALERSIPMMLERLGRLNPPPVRRVPLLIAGTGARRTLRLVARYADGWHAAFPDMPSELEPAVEALLRHCAEVGRDPADIEWGVGVEPDQLEAFLARDGRTYVEMGFTQFTLGFNGPDWSVDAAAPWLGWRDTLNAERGLPAALTA